MATAIVPATPVPVMEPPVPGSAEKPASSALRDYKGFVAGVFSGIAKLTG